MATCACRSCRSGACSIRWSSPASRPTVGSRRSVTPRRSGAAGQRLKNPQPAQTRARAGGRQRVEHSGHRYDLQDLSGRARRPAEDESGERISGADSSAAVRPADRSRASCGSSTAGRTSAPRRSSIRKSTRSTSPVRSIRTTRSCGGRRGPSASAASASTIPLLKKPITSELGNVSPWIVVPGPIRDKQLRFQAENVAASITNNASFNCVATKVIITWKNWPQRQAVSRPGRRGAGQGAAAPGLLSGRPRALCRFSGRPAASEPDDTLPWTLLRDADPAKTPQLFCEESFVCVCAETGLDGRRRAGLSPPSRRVRQREVVGHARRGGDGASQLSPRPAAAKPASRHAWPNCVMAPWA